MSAKVLLSLVSSTILLVFLIARTTASERTQSLKNNLDFRNIPLKGE
jgi:hypothetical protein